MTDNDDKFGERELRPNEKAFLSGLTRLAQKNGLTPREVLPLFGHLAMLVAQGEHDNRGTALEDAITSAMDLILSGAGMDEREIELELHTPPVNKDMH